MTVYALMPVFNRLTLTQSMLECLRAQQMDEPLVLVVVDDGSSDGTAEFLRTQSDVTVLQGDGSLWWGGAIDLALHHVLAKASDEDWVLLVNNDTRIESHYLQNLLKIAHLHAPAAVGSVIRDIQPPHRLLSIGPRINPARFRVVDALDAIAPGDETRTDIVSVDALSGRGALYPVVALRRVGGMRPRWLPHYLADYELALRVRSAGWHLLVGQSAVVYSTDEYGNTFRASSLWTRLFSVRSPAYLPARISFWWSASDAFQRVTLPFRAVARALIPTWRKKA